MSDTQPLQPGVYYHVYNRGNNREDLFPEERNYAYFLRLYSKYVDSVADTYAYCLLKNHFHFLLKIKSGVEQQAFWSSLPGPKPGFAIKNPSQQLSNLFNAYAKAINKATGRTGSLFEHPFHRKPVESQSYLLQVLRYIHHNPMRHGMIADFRLWPYSSYGVILGKESTSLPREVVLGWFRGREGFEEFHRQPDPEGLDLRS